MSKDDPAEATPGEGFTPVTILPETKQSSTSEAPASESWPAVWARLKDKRASQYQLVRDHTHTDTDGVNQVVVLILRSK